MKLNEAIKQVLIGEVKLSREEHRKLVNKAVDKFSKILHDLNNYINIKPDYLTFDSSSEGIWPDGSIWADIVTAENNDVLGNIYIIFYGVPEVVVKIILNEEQKQNVTKKFDINDPALLKLLKDPLSVKNGKTVNEPAVMTQLAALKKILAPKRPTRMLGGQSAADRKRSSAKERKYDSVTLSDLMAADSYI
jgi:hypothetical protein